MPVVKDKPDYVTFDPDFKPLPKYGHYSEMDPIFAQAKPMMDKFMDDQWDPQNSLEAFRNFWLKPSNPPEGCPQAGEDVVTETRQIPMRDEAEVEIKIYRAKAKTNGDSSSSSPSALVLRFHGGGFVVGGHGTEHPESLFIAGRTNSVVVSVDYRL